MPAVGPLATHLLADLTPDSSKSHRADMCWWSQPRFERLSHGVVRVSFWLVDKRYKKFLDEKRDRRRETSQKVSSAN